jgi:hypothetical protein
MAAKSGSDHSFWNWLTTCKLHKTLRPVLSHSSESWILKNNDKNNLLVFERMVLRTIYGAGRENSQWRSGYNSELYYQAYHDHVVKIIKAGRLKWAGHLARMDGEPTKILTSSKPEERRVQGRRKFRWLHSIKNLKVRKVNNWWRKL